MKKKNRSGVFWWCLSILFVVFMGLYVAQQSGYYESNLSKKTSLTSEKIKEFEEDVKNGKAIDINDYIVAEQHDYSSKASKLGSTISVGVEKFMTQGIQGMFDFVKTLFT